MTYTMTDTVDWDAIADEFERVNTIGRNHRGETFCSGCMTNVDTSLMGNHREDDHCKYCHELDC